MCRIFVQDRQVFFGFQETPPETINPSIHPRMKKEEEGQRVQPEQRDASEESSCHSSLPSLGWEPFIFSNLPSIGINEQQELLLQCHPFHHLRHTLQVFQPCCLPSPRLLIGLTNLPMKMTMRGSSRLFPQQRQPILSM